MAAKKGLDSTFVHYGIRQDDMRTIETLCTAHQLDFDWVKEDLLREYHERKIKSLDIEEKHLEKMIEKALLRIK